MRNRPSLRIIISSLLATFGLLISTAPTQAIDLGPSSDYLVRVTPEAKAAIEKALGQAGGKINSRYQYVFDGFLVKLPDIAVVALKKIPNILTIEKDAPVEGFDIQNNQSPTPSWGLDRVDQRTKVVSGSSGFGYRSAGTGSTIYIVDTGVFAHDDFKARLSSSGFSSISDGNGTVDCNGHGTHVAGTAAGSTYGIAKNARIVPVRVLNCVGSGTYSQVIAGLEWILSPENPNPKTQAVVNMSLGGGASSTIDAAVTKLTNSGIVVVVAAGNSNQDACNYSPARAPSAITVGATTISDAKSSYSNFGTCVDINAPGSDIASSWIGSATATKTISGTSMATPHVVGAAAVYLGLNPSASVAQVTQFLDQEATRDALTGLTTGTPNELLYVSPTDGGPAIVPPAVALKSVSGITHNAATISIDVNAGNAPTTVQVEYSVSATLATGVQKAVVTPSSFDGGALAVATANLTGLLPTQTYYFRISGTNEAGTTTSPIGNFATIAPPKTLASAVVVAPTELTAYSARLQGMVNAGSDITKVSFVYGTDPNFINATNTGVAIPAEVSGFTPVSVSLPISFLNGMTLYFVKIVATNSTGTASSQTLSFTTPASLGKPPIVVTDLIPTSINYYSQTFTGRVNPQGQTTNVSFTFGAESTLTSGAQTVNLTTGPITGETDVVVSITISNSFNCCGRSAYYRFNATNASGVTKGNVQSRTVSPIQPKILVTRADNSVAGQLTITTVANGGGSNVNWTVIYGTSPTLVQGDTTYPTLAPGATEVKLNPAVTAIGDATNTSASVLISGLANSTRYYYLVRLKPYTGTWSGQSFLMGGDATTLNVVAPTPTPTPTPVASPTPTPTPAPSVSPTPIASPTPTSSATPKPSPTPTPSPTPAPTASPTPIASPTPSPTPVPSASPTPIASPTPVPSPAPTSSPTPTPAPISSPAPTTSPTPTVSPTPTPAPGTDTQKPLFISGSVTPQSLEVCQTLNAVTAKVSDNVGVTEVTLRIVNPNGAQLTTINAGRFEGTALSGSYRNDWVVPCNAVVGRYRAEAIAVDAAKNVTAWTVLGEFNVTAPSVIDTAAPAVVSGAISQSTVVVCKAITEVKASIKDDTRVKSATAGIFNQQGAATYYETLYLRSGTAQDGIWTNDFNVPCLTVPGTFTVMVRAIDQWDKASDWKAVGTVTVTAAPVASPTPAPVVTPAPVASPAPVVSPSPTTSPTPAPVPVQKTAQSITVTALTDWEKNASQPISAKASSGLQITYISMTPEICYVIGSGTSASVQRQARLADAPFWTCTIRSTQAGDARFEAAPSVDTTFKFLKARMAVTVSTSTTLAGVGPNQVISTLGTVDSSMMSGLSGLSILLGVTSTTPTVCQVTRNELWDRSGGAATRTYVTGLSNGICTLKFDYPGDASRLPTTLNWSAKVTNVPIPTGSSITLQAISGNVINGKEVVGVMTPGSEKMFLNGMDKGRVQINVSVRPMEPMATMGLDARGTYSEQLWNTMKITSLTPTVCNFQTNSPQAVTTLNGGGPVFVMPLAVGTCTVRFDFAGIPDLKVAPSWVSWSAPVSKS